MKVIIAVAVLTVLAFVGNSYGETVWLSGQVKDEEGKTICIYKSGFDKIYIPAEIGDYCPINADK